MRHAVIYRGFCSWDILGEDCNLWVTSLYSVYGGDAGKIKRILHWGRLEAPFFLLSPICVLEDTFSLSFISFRTVRPLEWLVIKLLVNAPISQSYLTNPTVYSLRFSVTA